VSPAGLRAWGDRLERDAHRRRMVSLPRAFEGKASLSGRESGLGVDREREEGSGWRAFGRYSLRRAAKLPPPVLELGRELPWVKDTRSMV